jgi:phage tail sheath gpL-like
MICCLVGMDDRDWDWQYLVTPSGFLQTICDFGTVTIIVNGHSDSVPYSSGSTASSIASALVNTINGDGAAFVSATLSGATVVLTAKTTGSATNHPLSSSVTFDSGDFGSASFATSNSGAALTGGANIRTSGANGCDVNGRMEPGCPTQ